MKCLLDKIDEIKKIYGDTFYVLDVDQFEINYAELDNVFNKYYPNSHISYSYKTNYIPALCKVVLNKGGYAEVVSDMEYRIAREVGVPKNKVIYNGPWKAKEAIEDIVINGGIVNLDSMYDFNVVKEIAESNRVNLDIGIRVNFDIGDGVNSRFGFDISGKDFKEVLNYLNKVDSSLNLVGIHSHFATRDIKYWPNRAKSLIKLIEECNLDIKYFSLGGGIYGKMDESLKAQFDNEIPSYEDYAKAVCPILFNFFKKKKELPMLFLEPGSALVGDCMNFACPVVSIKEVRGKSIATLLGSIYNINPTLNKKNPPIHVYHPADSENLSVKYENLNFGGFTCIESDYLYKNYSGTLAVGDLVIFRNVGSYSIVLKPPFILPNFPVVSIQNGEIILVKRKETFDDIFQTYKF